MSARTTPLVAVALAALMLVGCAAPSAPAEPSGAAPAPTASTAAPEPQPTETPDPRAGWRSIETQDGLFRWQIPADWTVVDESFEAEDGLGWANRLTVTSELGQDLAFFGSASYGDRGGICASADAPLVDAEGFVPALIHDDELIDLGEGLLGMDLEPVEGARLVAHTSTSDDEAFTFYAGYTQHPMREDAVPCLQYADVAVPDDYPHTSFGTTYSIRSLWDVDSFEQGAAYTETEEYRELMEMFRSLELTGAHR